MHTPLGVASVFFCLTSFLLPEIIMESILPEEARWAETLDCAITVCDADAKIIYMNERSRETFARHGDIIGHDLLQYHPPRAQGMIRHMLATGESNHYTISKQGKRKIVHQSAWRKDGKVAGLVEITFVIPEEMPHYIR